MTISSRAARGVRKMRAQLRDLAAAEHGAAAATTAIAQAAVRTERAGLADESAAAAARLARATSVYALDRVADGIASQRAVVVAAEATHAAASQLAEQAAARLREKIRQLKTVERVVELIDHERSARDAKAEQRAHDDLNARRR